MSPLLAIALILGSALVILLSAIVSGFETALFAVRPHHGANIAGNDRRLRAKLRWLFQRSRESRGSILILGAALNLSVIVAGLFGIEHFQGSVSDRRGAVTGLLFAVILIGDVGPKIFALARPALPLRWFATPFLVVTVALGRISLAARKVCDVIEFVIVPRSFKRRQTYSEEEYEALLELHREEGSLDEGETEIIGEIVKLGNKTAKDCMTPRVDAFALPAGLPRQQLLARLDETDWWRVPIYADSTDAITGILDVRAVLQQSEGADVAEAVDPPVFVPETMRALNAFRDFLAEPHSLVIVLDEYGGTEGVLTHEDVIQEIIGEATPAAASEEAEFQFLSHGRVLATGAARLDELGQAMGVDLERDGLDSIGGLVFNELGRLPQPGERVDLGQVRVVIRKVGPMRIEELLVERIGGAE